MVNASPKKGIQWKSLRNDGTFDKLKIEITPNGAEKAVYLTLLDSINYDVRPKVLSSNAQNIEVKANQAGETSLIPKIGYFINDTIQIKIISKALVNNIARIVIVNESNDDVQVVPYGNTTRSDTTIVISSGNNKFLDSRMGIDIGGDDSVIYRTWAKDSVVIAGKNKICESHAYQTNIVTTSISITQLRNTLNKYYSQGLYHWNIDPIVITKTINFDFNRDGMIDVSSWNNPETKAIYDSCIIDNTKVNFIVVDNPNDGSNGMSVFPIINPNKICFLHPNISPNVYMTATHEIGHGIFSLKHPFNEFIGFPKGGKDIYNIMNYGNYRNKFRKYQWDNIK